MQLTIEMVIEKRADLKRNSLLTTDKTVDLISDQGEIQDTQSIVID